MISRELFTDIVCLILIYSFLLIFFPPDLMLSETTTTGGDMGSHYAPAHYLKNYLLPHGKLIGWYPHWLAGTPMFQFYFVPPYLLMCLLSYFVSLEVAFKLVTVSGIFLLPLASYFCVRFLGFEYPAPSIAAAFSLALLFLETYSQWGGNIMSTLAGEFSYMISFSLTVLLFGALYYSIEKNKPVVPVAVLLALVVLTHIYTAIFISSAAVFFVLVGDRWRNLVYLFKVFLVAGLITSFWTIPLIAKLPYSAAPKDVFYGFPALDRFINPTFFVFYFFAAFSVGCGLVRGDRRVLYFLWAFFCLICLILFIRHINLLYIRFTPILYFLPLLLAAEGLSRLSKGMRALPLFAVIVVLASLLWVDLGFKGIIQEFSDEVPDAGPLLSLVDNPLFGSGVSNVPAWIRWNYEGLESKPGYKEFIELNEHLKSAPLSGRIDFEYSDAYNAFGTPRLFEASPVFSNRSVMEALFLESSLTFPFFYFIQKQVSQQAWWPGFPLEIPSFDPDAGAESLRLYNVQYFVAYSADTKSALANSSRYHLINSIGDFSIYSLNEDSQYVEPPKREPVLVVTDDWRHFSFDWFSSRYRDVPLVFSRDLGDYELSHFRVIVLDKPAHYDALKVSGKRIYSSEDIWDALNASEPIKGNCSVSERISEEEVSVQTDCVSPLLVKVSYFPNWFVEGAEKIYLASPSIMLIFPEKEDIRIYYGETLPDTLGNLFSVFGLLIVFYWILTNVRFFRETIHEPLMALLWTDSMRPFVLKQRNLFVGFCSEAFYYAEKNWRILLIVFFVLLFAFGVLFYFNEKAACDESCRIRGFNSSIKHFRGEVVDKIKLGSIYLRENQMKRGFECTAVCDSSRSDMVYVSGGYIAFNLSFVSGVDNTLVLRLWDNAKCRSGDLFVNDIFLARIESNGKYDWHDFEVNVPKEYIVSSNLRLRIEHINRDCYGWDISEAYVKAPTCLCY